MAIAFKAATISLITAAAIPLIPIAANIAEAAVPPLASQLTAVLLKLMRTPHQYFFRHHCQPHPCAKSALRALSMLERLESAFDGANRETSKGSEQ